MTIAETIEQASNDANIRTFAYANLKEFNAFADSFKFNDYPANVVVPFENPGTWLNGRRKSVLNIQGWVVTRLSESPENYRTAKVEAIYLQPMRALAIKFMRKLVESDLVDPEISEINDNIVPEYMWLDSGLFGVSYSIRLPISESIC